MSMKMLAGWILAAIFGLSLLFSNHACAFDFPAPMQASAGRGHGGGSFACVRVPMGCARNGSQVCLREVERQKLASLPFTQ